MIVWVEDTHSRAGVIYAAWHLSRVTRDATKQETDRHTDRHRKGKRDTTRDKDRDMQSVAHGCEDSRLDEGYIAQPI